MAKNFDVAFFPAVEVVLQGVDAGTHTEAFQEIIRRWHKEAGIPLMEGNFLLTDDEGVDHWFEIHLRDSQHHISEVVDGLTKLINNKKVISYDQRTIN